MRVAAASCDGWEGGWVAVWEADVWDGKGEAMRVLECWVGGEPVAQPRARAVSFRGHARMYDPGTAKVWKGCVKRVVGGEVGRIGGWSGWPAGVPLRMELVFMLKRPKGHYGTGRNAGRLKGGLPGAPMGRPDLDNLAKAVMDALTDMGLWADDSQVVDLRVRKLWEQGETGCHVRVSEWGLE